MSLRVTHKFVSAKSDSGDPTIIQPSNWNADHSITYSPGYLLASDYSFAAQAPGGSLIIGSNTITLTPVPLGINGTDTSHYLWIYGGVGTQEAVLITGGTAVSGAASGTVIVTCANTHSGAWGIKSASGGLKEMDIVGGIGYNAYLPPGEYDIFSPIVVNVTSGNVKQWIGAAPPVSGLASGTVLLNLGVTDLLHVVSDNASTFILEKVALFGTVSSGHGLLVDNCNALTLREVYQISSSVEGGLCNNCTTVLVENCCFSTNGLDGLRFTAVSDSVNVISSFFRSNYLTGAGPGYGLSFFNCIGISVVGCDFEGNGYLGRSSYPTDAFGLGFNSCFSLVILGCYFERNLSQSIYLGNNVKGFTVGGCYFEESGIYCDSGCTNGTITGCYCTNVLNTTKAISGVIDNGHGFCEITTSVNHLLSTTAMINIANVVGVPCNVPGVVTKVWTPTVVDVNIPFSGSYSSGGTLIQVSGMFFTNTNDIKVENNYIAEAGTYFSSVLNQVKNYIATESGVNNAVTCVLVDNSGGGIPLIAGLQITLKLAHSLQAGANTLAFNTVVKNIKSNRNPASNIGTAYVSGSLFTAIYDGTQWLDISQ